ncbi:MAG: hypothetical protein Q4P78_05300 [Rothia sp. (in: high G+C Gram-positive bacteria)]|uniref:hypothetical protein n=1 Tax=Rothia sp. (in: high G+C Gram-positive bacteria) TaxID=1885016 RepID=UPI0026E04200|nr:hypothetical protein [Rothia sp. (in: high G+C Gram-positive bacteria)]MDO5750602.1 hypothetical protein [Rothia sp. (in: high G+C Gram-positive bacteria)]
MRHTALVFIALAFALLVTRFATGLEWLTTVSMLFSTCAAVLLFLHSRAQKKSPSA